MPGRIRSAPGIFHPERPEMPVLRSTVLLVFFAALFLGCGNAPPTGADENAQFQSQDGVRFRAEVVASGLEVPWAFAWLPSGDLMFTERPGRVRIVESGTLRPAPIYTVPDVEPSSESA